MFKFSVLSTEKAAGENVLPLRELPCLCLMICVNIIKKAAKEVLAAIFMIFYLTERKFVVLFLDRVTGYEPVGRGFESLLAYQRGVLIGLPFELFVNIFQKLHVGVQLFSVLKLWIEGLFPYYNIRRFL